MAMVNCEVEAEGSTWPGLRLLSIRPPMLSPRVSPLHAGCCPTWMAWAGPNPFRRCSATEAPTRLSSPLPSAHRLLSDLDNVDWADSIKEMQRNWIGRSEGATIRFALAPGEGAAVPAGEEGASESGARSACCRQLSQLWAS